MATDQRTPGSALTDRLLGRPQGHDLFQAIGLLERAAPQAERLGTGNGRDEAVRLSAVVSLGFPASDVAHVSRIAPGDGRTDPADAAGAVDPFEPSARRWRLDSPLMALAGAGGPLPLAYTEMLLASRGARDNAPLDFLDIFQHRWLSLLYRGRKKHHVSLQWDATPELAHSPLARTIDALSGVDLGARGPAGERVWLRHAALQGAAPRSLAQLESLVADRLGLPVSGRPFIGGWQTVDERETTRLAGRRLGQANGLANGPTNARMSGAASGTAQGATNGAVNGRATLGGSVLGQRAWDSSAGVALDVGPVPWSRWAALLPGGADLNLLRWLVGRHVSQDFQLHVTLQPESAPAALRPRLGQPGGPRLGWSSWLTGSGAQARTPAPVRLRLGSTAAPGSASAGASPITPGPATPAA